ncbi:MAG: DUF433 domain-containing protein [Planctomycetales bacterium]|nr:DUF433 domain-containing protein [Planctomycetales bacterium]
MSTVEYAHITTGPDNMPMLAGTRIKVVEIVLDHLAHGADVQEIHREFPHLSLGEIHSALAYYYDHQQEMDADIARRLQRAGEFREKFEATSGPSPLRMKLKAKGLLP